MDCTLNVFLIPSHSPGGALPDKMSPFQKRSAAVQVSIPSFIKKNIYRIYRVFNLREFLLSGQILEHRFSIIIISTIFLNEKGLY